MAASGSSFAAWADIFAADTEDDDATRCHAVTPESALVDTALSSFTIDSALTLQNALDVLENSSSLSSKKFPMFLQKLYRIVSEPSTNDLISWSEAGDSFFVFDQECLAREHLGKWFKHNKFNSFVRQLNMYGFHKIPHLQAGVLKSDSATETPEYAHEHFHRDREDHLCLIKRKANKDQPGSIPTPIAFPALPPPPPQFATNQVQPLDERTIISGIAAIRKHQVTISNDLNDLRRSNEALWKESATARKKHQKQQHTINRIVKFLAGVFGHQAGDVPKDGELTPPPSASKNLSRLTIKDHQSDKFGKVAVAEVEDEEQSPTFSKDSSDRFFSMDAPRSSTGHDAPSPVVMGDSSIPLPTSQTDPSAPPVNIDSISTSPERTLTPSKELQFDPIFQATVNQFPPAELSAFVTALMNQPPIADPGDFLSSSMPMSYNPTTDLFASPSPRPLLTSSPQASPPILHSMSYDPAMDWQATENIGKQVDLVDTDINSLMQGIGLDPSFLTLSMDHSHGFGDVANSTGHAGDVSSSASYDFLDNFQQSSEGVGQFIPDELPGTAFLGEAPSPASPNTNSDLEAMGLPSLPHGGVKSGKRGQKRKSDIGVSYDDASQPAVERWERRDLSDGRPTNSTKSKKRQYLGPL